jgi:hypothetical protein
VGSYRLGLGVSDVPEHPSLSYADAADFMLRELSETAHRRLTLDVFN